jgi:uncharacterized membrane protein YqhA
MSTEADDPPPSILKTRESPREVSSAESRSRGSPMESKRLEDIFEQSLFRSRWLMAPFYVGLVIALLVLLIAFGRELMQETSSVFTFQLEENKVVLWLLTLIDMSLA